MPPARPSGSEACTGKAHLRGLTWRARLMESLEHGAEGLSRGDQGQSEHGQHGYGAQHSVHSALAGETGGCLGGIRNSPFPSSSELLLKRPFGAFFVYLPAAMTCFAPSMTVHFGDCHDSCARSGSRSEHPTPNSMTLSCCPGVSSTALSGCLMQACMLSVGSCSRAGAASCPLARWRQAVRHSPTAANASRTRPAHSRRQPDD